MHNPPDHMNHVRQQQHFDGCAHSASKKLNGNITLDGCCMVDAGGEASAGGATCLEIVLSSTFRMQH
jgi:hypothetical protein